MSRFTMVVSAHVFLIRDNQILLLERQNTGYADGLFSVPAGHLDGGEKVTAAAVREALEEAGVTIKPSDLRVATIMHRISDREQIDFFVVAERWRGSVSNLEPDKCRKLEWVDLDKLPDAIVPYVAQAIRNYRAGIPFAEFGWQGVDPTFS